MRVSGDWKGLIQKIRNEIINMQEDKYDWETLDWLANARELIHWANSIVDGVPVLLLIRHSHRETIESMEEMVEKRITPLGKEMAVEFGKRLPTNRELEIMHSFVPRCRETAHAIAEGFEQVGGEVRSIEDVVFLVGPQVLDRSIWGRLGTDGESTADFVNYWADGKFPEQKIEPFEQYIHRVKDEFVKRLISSEDNALHVHVTHDLTLLSSKRHFFRNPIDISMRPPYLGGLGITIEGNRLMIFDPIRD